MGSMMGSPLEPGATAVADASSGQSALVGALSADAAVLRADRCAWKNARIHSVFDRVINVDLGNGRLLTLAHRESDDAPDTVVTDIARWSDRRVRVGNAVQFMGEKIFLGAGLCVALDDAEPWSCVLPKYPADDALLRGNLALAHEHLEGHGFGIGLQSGKEQPKSDVDKTLVSRFREGSQGLCGAIMANDESAAQQHVDRLVGLGPGLTPAGDDFLLGLLAVLNLPDSPSRSWRRLGPHVVASAVRRTNAISLAALRHAAIGQVRESLVRFCSALIQLDQRSALSALDEVLAIGASSGTDIALGMLTGFKLHAHAIKSSNRPS